MVGSKQIGKINVENNEWFSSVMKSNGVQVGRKRVVVNLQICWKYCRDLKIPKKCSIGRVLATCIHWIPFRFSFMCWLPEACKSCISFQMIARVHVCDMLRLNSHTLHSKGTSVSLIALRHLTCFLRNTDIPFFLVVSQLWNRKLDFKHYLFVWMGLRSVKIRTLTFCPSITPFFCAKHT